MHWGKEVAAIFAFQREHFQEVRLLFADLGYRRDCRSAFAVDKGSAILCFFEVESVSGLYFAHLAVAEIPHSLGK